MQSQDSQRTILLVEDNPVDIDLTRRAFTKHLRLNPMELARDGEEALSFIDQWTQGAPRPLMILMDIKLPKLSGLEVLKRIKNHPDFKKIPIVMLTSSSNNRDIEAAYANGANSYIVKPVNFDEFIDVAKYLEIYWMGLNTPAR